MVGGGGFAHLLPFHFPIPFPLQTPPLTLHHTSMTLPGRPWNGCVYLHYVVVER
jgi:hypothetical protein